MRMDARGGGPLEFLSSLFIPKTPLRTKTHNLKEKIDSLKSARRVLYIEAATTRASHSRATIYGQTEFLGDLMRAMRDFSHISGCVLRGSLTH